MDRLAPPSSAAVDAPVFEHVAEEARKGAALAVELLELMQARVELLSLSDLRAIAENLDALAARAGACAETLDRMAAQRTVAEQRAEAAAHQRGAKLVRRTSLMTPAASRPSTIS
jgi:hypothetical protein